MRKFLIIITSFFCYVKISYAQELGIPSTLPVVKYHLTARPWQPLNISRNVYLDKLEGIVREIAKYQNSTGAIIDPYINRELQYSTPYFAHSLGTLLSAGRCKDLLQKGVAAMNSATADVETGLSAIPDSHGEFFLAPLAIAIPLYTPFISSIQLNTWKNRMAKPIEAVIMGHTHNWRAFAMKGEWMRAKNGYVNKETAVKWLEDSWINTQKTRFTNNSWNFYHDNSSDPDAWPYESIARSNLLSMIDEGYTGASRNEILNILKNGTQSSLLLQDPSGQSVAGGRTGNHTWNDMLLANAYETMSEMAFKEGDTRLAGQYRQAAALAFQNIQRWRRADGTYSITKNHFSPKDRVRFAKYSDVTNYNGMTMHFMAENYLTHRTNIPPQATPNEIGGYTIVSDKKLATAVANAGGMHMQVCLRGSTSLVFGLYWSTLGVVRFARPGWDSRLGPSDGVRDNLGVSFAPTFLESGNWIRLASVPDRYEAFFTTQFTHPLLVRCQVLYKPKTGKTGPTFTNDFVITPDGILSTLTSTTSNYGLTWPLLTFDGSVNLKTGVTSHIASTSYPGKTDEQNFIALHTSPAITSTEATIRSAYGDLRPVRVVSGTTSNVTFIYPRSMGDLSAESVRKSYTRSGNDFSTVLGRVKGNIYVGRTSAGGVGTSIDINNDNSAEATFNISTGFVMQLENGKIIKIETDKDVTAVIQGQTVNIKAYTPVAVANQFPVANAGPDKSITLPVNSVELSGSGSDPENGINVTYAWTQVSGPNTAIFNNASVATPAVSGLAAGSYVFRLIVKDQQAASSAPDQVTVTVNPATGGQQVVSFTLVNASTEKDIQTLTNGAVLNLATLPTKNLNVRANTNPATVGRVVFALTGAQVQNRSEAGNPYALFGDVNGNYSIWIPPAGNYTLKASPFTAATGGTAGTALTISFSVINSAPITASLTLGSSNTNSSVKPATLVRPNPATDVVNIKLDNYTTSAVTLQLVDRNGARIKEWKFAPSLKQKTYQLNISNLPPGLYLMRITDEKGSMQTEKIVIGR